MLLSRSPVVVWVLGALVAAGAALGSYCYFRHPAVVGKGPEEPCAADEDLTLPQSEREYLWQVEHGGNLLVRDGFGPLAAAMRRADAPALLALLSDDFQGATLDQPSEAAWRSDWLTAVRQSDGGKPPRALGRSQFVERLLEFRRAFHAEPKVKLSLMRLSPVDRADPDGPWQGTCQLRMSGEREPGQPGEVIAYLSYRVRRPTEEGLKAGRWLTACSVDQSQVGHASRPLFREVAVERGLDVARLHNNWKDRGEPNMLCGAYLCDYDRDGILDLLVNDPGGIRLYKGLPGGKFKDVTDEAGLFWAPPVVMYAAFVDLDGDGWDDLILGQRVYKNENGKRFTDVTSRCNLALPPDASGIAVADFNRDGKLDLYVTRTGAGKADSWLTGRSGRGDGNHLWRNKGNWQFEDVTAKAGAGGGYRSTFTAVWLDANNDGWPDLYVPNEFGNGVLLVNQHDGTFKEHSLSEGPSDFGTMGVTAGDIDNDGHIDLYMGNMYSKAGTRVIGNLRPDAYPEPILAKMRSFVAGSQLHRNLGGLKFEQKGRAWQLNDCGWAYGPCLADLDNDGWLDLYATAGFVSRDRDKPDG
jgi:hypothetical protein